MTYSIPAWIRSTHSEDGAVVLDVRRGLLFNFNSIGSDLLQMLKSGPTSDEALSKAITARYDIDLETARNDVEEFVQALREHHLIDQIA